MEIDDFMNKTNGNRIKCIKVKFFQVHSTQVIQFFFYFEVNHDFCFLIISYLFESFDGKSHNICMHENSNIKK